MKIGKPAEQTAPLPASATAQNSAAAADKAAKGKAPTAIPTQADDSAKIELSNAASTLLAPGTTAEFDAEKVARISKSIDEGSFKINPEAIADKLIANAQEVLSKNKG